MDYAELVKRGNYAIEEGTSDWRLTADLVGAIEALVKERDEANKFANEAYNRGFNAGLGYSKSLPA